VTAPSPRFLFPFLACPYLHSSGMLNHFSPPPHSSSPISQEFYFQSMVMAIFLFTAVCLPHLPVLRRLLRLVRAPLGSLVSLMVADEASWLEAEASSPCRDHKRLMRPLAGYSFPSGSLSRLQVTSDFFLIAQDSYDARVRFLRVFCFCKYWQIMLIRPSVWSLPTFN